MGKKHNLKEKNPNWNGGRYKTDNGYIMINLPKHPKARYNRPYIPEHRLIVEAFLGRFLRDEEEVHHINGIRDDNKIKNLMVFPNHKEHQNFHSKIRKFGLTIPIKIQIKNRWIKKNLFKE